MTYEETIDYLYNSLPVFQKSGSSAYKEGLENTIAIDSATEHPHKSYRTIHVAGTNGKGSTSHLIASILQESGYKVGLYTSPHLVDFRERIRINGSMITREYVLKFVDRYIDLFNKINPSFFEVTTGMAFAYFAEENINVAVVEVGLGGRLDCTNIISPDLSVITNISFDHTTLLGKTLSAIATEKAGIIKPQTPVVIGECIDETKNVFLSKAYEKKAPLFFAEKENLIRRSELLSSGKWLFQAEDYPDLTGELGGLAQKKNAETVLCSIKQLQNIGYSIPPHAVYGGFANVTKNTGLRGRWECLGLYPKIIADTGHNVAGIEYIVRQLQQEKYDRLHIVIGMVEDKDIDSMLELFPLNATYYFTKASVPRAMHEHTLLEKAEKFGLQGNSYPTVPEALQAAKNMASPADFIFIGGSTFIVADAL